jgi:hypothetical protein
MRLATGLAALLTTLWGAYMIAAFSCGRSEFPRGLASPVLAIELVNTEADVLIVVSKCPAESLRQSARLDLLLIPFYVAYLALGGWMLGADWAVPLAIGAGLADYAENYFILESLRGAAPHQLFPSLIKWALLGAALAILGLAWLRSGLPLYTPPVRKILGAAHVAAALLMLAALPGHWSPLGYLTLEPGTGILSLIIAGNAFGLLRNVR